MSAPLPARRRSFTGRLIALGLTVTLGFSAVLVSVLWEGRGQEREAARKAAANVLATLGSEIDRNLELYDLSLQAVVEGLNFPGIADVTPELRQLVLFDRAATAQGMGSIFVLDRAGNVTIDSRTLTPPPANYVTSDFFKVQSYGSGVSPYISRPWLSADGDYLIAISRRLSAPDGSFAGAVVGTLRLSYLEAMFRKIKLGERSALSLVRQDGSLIMRLPFVNGMIGRNLAVAPIFQKTVTYPSGSFDRVAGLDGIARMYVFQRVGEQPLVLSLGTSIDDIYAAWRQKAWLIGMLMAVMCAINVALITFLAHALNRRSEAEYQLSRIATIDGLTNLCNRRRLDEIFDAEWQRALDRQNAIALLMIDADNFKRFNDQFGHQAGDVALLAIARCIETGAEAAAGISARYGGEEFAVLLPDRSAADAVVVAETIRKNLLALRADQQNRPDSTPTVSIGAASMVPRHGLLPRDLIRAADTALYAAKRLGRDRTEFNRTESDRIEAAPRPAHAIGPRAAA